MGQGKNTGQVSLVPRFIQPMTSLPSLCLSKIEKSTWSTSSLILDIALPLRSNARSPVITNFNFSSINIHISTHLYSLKINSQTEDTQVGYISQKYTLEKYSLGKCIFGKDTFEKYTFKKIHFTLYAKVLKVPKV